MGLDFQQVSVPFGGIDTITEEKLVLPGKLTRSVNSVMKQKGRLEKRFGFAAIERPDLNNIDFTQAFSKELLVSGSVDGREQQVSWSPGANNWVTKGDIQPVSTVTNPVINNSLDCTGGDVAVGVGLYDGFSCYAYMSGNQVNIAMFDEETQQSVFTAGLVAGSSDPRVVSLGPNFAIFYVAVSSSIPALFFVVLNSITQTLSAPVLVSAASGAEYASGYEARPVTNIANPYIAIVYGDLFTGNLNAKSYDPLSSQFGNGINGFPAPFTITTGLALTEGTSFIGMTAGDNNIAVFWAEDAGRVQLTWFNNNLQSTSAIFTIDTVNSVDVEWGKATLALRGHLEFFLYYESLENRDGDGNVITVPSIKRVGGNVNTAGGVTVYLDQRNIELAADAFVYYQSQFFVPVMYGGHYACYVTGSSPYFKATYQPIPTQQNTDFLILDGETPDVIQRRSQQNAGGPTAFKRCPQFNLTGSGDEPVVYVWASGQLTQQTQGYDGAEDIVRSVCRAETPFGVQLFSSVVNRSLNVTGGYLSNYAGNLFTEQNYHVAPEPPVLDCCNVAVCRTVQGDGTIGDPTKAETCNIYVPPDRENPNGTVIGSGWQVKPGSYITLGTQSQGTLLTYVTAPAVLPADSTVIVSTTAGFPATNGVFWVDVGGQFYPVAYTSTTPTSFLNCTISGGTLTLSIGNSALLGQNMLVSPASNGQPVTSATINVVSTAGVYQIPPNVYISTAAGMTVTGFTTLTPTTVAGCTWVSGTGSLATGDSVSMSPCYDFIAPPSGGTSLPQTTVTVTGTFPATGFPNSGTITIVTSSGRQVVAYTSIVGSTFYGCTGGIGPLTNGDLVFFGASPGIDASMYIYVWFAVDGFGVDPLPYGPGGFGLQCAIHSTDSAQTVANKLYLALLPVSYSNPNIDTGPRYFVVSTPAEGTPITGGAGVSWYVQLMDVVGVTSYSGTATAGIGAAYSENFSIDPFIDTTATANYSGATVTCCSGEKIMPGGYFLVPVSNLAPAGGGIPYTQTYVLWFQVSYDGGVTYQGVPPVAPNFWNASSTLLYVPVQIFSTDNPTVVATKVQAALVGIGAPAEEFTSYQITIAGGGLTPIVTIAVGTGWQSTQPITAFQGDAAGILPDGEYIYTAIWEQIGDNGEVQRSQPSLPVSMVVQGASNIWNPQTPGSMVTQSPSANGMLIGGYLLGGCSPRLRTESLFLTQKQNSGLVIYRTVVNSGSPVEYERVTDPSSPLLNPPLSDSITTNDVLTYMDTVPDNELQGNQALYTNGEVVDNEPLPSCSFLTYHRGRLWGIPTETPSQIWFSKLYVQQEQVAVEFSDEQIQTIDFDVVGMATLDDKLIFFGATVGQIYYISGDGPDDTGLNGSFTPPEQIQTDVGCISAGSIQSTPQGVWFQSEKGFHFIDRQLTVTFRGADVKGLTQDPATQQPNFICRRAVLMPDRNETRFFMQPIPGTYPADQMPAAYVLVYNDLFDIWSQFTNWDGQDACLFQGTLTWGDAGGNVQQESTSLYTDNGAVVSMLAEVAWAKPAGLQGYCKTRHYALLGTFGSPHTLQARIGYNYEDYTELMLWDSTKALDDTFYGQETYGEMIPYGESVNGKVYQIRGTPALMSLESIRFEFSDTGLGAGGSGMMLEDLTLEVGLESGVFRVAQGKQVG